jgi:septal ring factor EnvC (AmiA/AmiB activator)
VGFIDNIDYLAVSTAIGGALGYLLNWLRQMRKDAYSQVSEATQKLIDQQNTRIMSQDSHIQRLEGRLEQLTLQQSTTMIESARANAKLEVANQTIERLKNEIVVWQERWDTRFPIKETP